MASIGISTEPDVVRGVLLLDESGGVLGSVEHPAGDTGTAPAVASVLERLVAELEGGVALDGAVVAYRSPDERRAIVSNLPPGPWRSPSLVSAKSAHLATVQAMTGLDDYGPLLVCDVVPGRSTMSIVDTGRTRVIAHDSVATKGASLVELSDAVAQGERLIELVGIEPDAVVLLGSRAAEADVEFVLERGFSVPVVRAPEFVTATAIGAAILAARHFEEPPEPAPVPPPPPVLTVEPVPVPVPEPEPEPGPIWVAMPEPIVVDEPVGRAAQATDAPQKRRGALLVAAILAVLLGAGAFGVTALTREPAVPEPVAAAAPTAAPASVAPEAPPLPVVAAEPTAIAEQAVAVQPSVAAKPVEVSVPLVEIAPQQAPEPVEAAPPPLPATGSAGGVPGENKVGAPDSALLFPGEAPPPALTDPAFQQWWDNHWQLVSRWIQGD